MTLRGVFSLLFEMVLLIMALGTNIKEFLIVAVCIGGLLLYALLSVLIAVFCLRFKAVPKKGQETLRGEETGFELKVKGLALLPVVCKIRVKPADNGDVTAKTELYKTFILAGFNWKRKYSLPLCFPHTGYWQVGVSRLRLTDVFGMFSLPSFFSRKSQRLTTVAVLPNIHDAQKGGSAQASPRGLVGATPLNSENGEVLGDSRLYKEGDAMRRINWKLTARSGKLYTRQFENPHEPQAVIAIDTFCPETDVGFEDIVRETAVTLASALLQEGIEVKIITFEERSVGEPKCINLTRYDELDTLKYALVDIEFKKDTSPLELYSFEGRDFVEAEEIFVLVSNPSNILLSTIAEEQSAGRSVSCILADDGKLTEDYAVKTANETGVLPIIVSGTDQIEQKVGVAVE